MIIVTLAAILINRIIPITQDGRLVGKLIASYLEDPVISFTTFAILGRFTRSPVLLDFILPRCAELNLIDIPFSLGDYKRIIELAVRWRRWHGWRRWGIVLTDRVTVIAI